MNNQNPNEPIDLQGSNKDIFSTTDSNKNATHNNLEDQRQHSPINAGSNGLVKD